MVKGRGGGNDDRRGRKRSRRRSRSYSRTRCTRQVSPSLPRSRRALEKGQKRARLAVQLMLQEKYSRTSIEQEESATILQRWWMRQVLYSRRVDFNKYMSNMYGGE